jgi:small subunit ribosomal protein S4e
MSKHLKRYAAPRSWTLLRKERMFVQKPLPGRHLLEGSMPLSLILKNMGFASTQRDVKKALQRTEVLVDGKRTKEPATGLGFMDTLTLKSTGDSYRVTIDTKGRLQLNRIDKPDNTKTCRIEGKSVLKKGKIQLNLSGSRNMIVEKESYSVGDSIVISIPAQKIVKHLKLDKGAKIFLVSGAHKGTEGVIDEIAAGKVIYHDSQGNKIDTPKNAVFVIP